jgi:HSP20 family protein
MVDTMMLSPVTCMYPSDDYENLIIEVILPGVEKKDISFKLDEDSFYVVANKAGVKYLDTYSTCCPVNPKKAVAKYSNGVLKVTVPYQKPLDNLVSVKIE